MVTSAEALERGFAAVRGVRELAELARHQVRRLLADVDRVVADALEAARDDDHAQAPLAQGLVAAELQHVRDDAAVGPVDQLVEVDQHLRARDVARGERRERDADHLLRAHGDVLEARDERLVGRQALRELRQLGDRHAVVAHALEVQVDVQHREHEPQVDRDRRLQRQQALDALLQAVVAAIDLVVERDHLVGQIDVASIERVDRRAQRPQHVLPLLLQRGLEAFELLVEDVARHPRMLAAARSEASEA